MLWRLRLQPGVRTAPLGYAGYLTLPFPLIQGHTKCALALLAKIVRYRPVYATMFVAASLEEKAMKEINAQLLLEVEDDMRKLIMSVVAQYYSHKFLTLPRVVPLQTGSNILDSTLFNENFMKEYRNLLEHGHIGPDGDASTDGIAPGPPQLVILDVCKPMIYAQSAVHYTHCCFKFFLYNTFQSIREVSGSSIPIYALQSASVAACLFMFGPENIGGLGDLDEKLKAIPYTDTESVNQESERVRM